jgi:hypothetical protein
MKNQVYVFMGEGANFPAGIFESKEKAEEVIKRYSLTGILSLYPIDMLLYDWAIEKNISISKGISKSPKYIGQFSCASVDHFHYEEGVCLT